MLNLQAIFGTRNISIYKQYSRRLKTGLLTKTDFKRILKVYNELFENPEPSGSEKQTSKILINYLRNHTNPNRLLTNVGGYGVIADYSFGEKSNNTVLLRADMDAVPVPKHGKLYSHQCGHNGHMSILLGVAELLKKKKEQAQRKSKESVDNNLNGRVILLFQPSEENGQGAYKMINDPKFLDLNLKKENTKCFALHNIPSYPQGSVILTSTKIFSCASVGTKVSCQGETSHASIPNEGKNPYDVLIPFCSYVSNLPRQIAGFQRALVTPVNLTIGKEWNYGTSPGDGEFNFTLRSTSNEVMNEMKNAILNYPFDQNYQIDIKFNDDFPASENDPSCKKIIIDSAQQLNYQLIERQTAFPWSEDFSHFLLTFKGAIFGLGSGLNNSQLHTHNYQFPEEIIPYGINVFSNIIENILSQN
ncbi:clan mh [Anaeramoeba flamelloides]|uniref:Clan mh n=1 Tax=Anaeramoeba flamelloides TaxID=1746091 RepID=A0ABQ8YFB0_9EUKA|nr:clan mh [Anaeramoeba flamelloides]